MEIDKKVSEAFEQSLLKYLLKSEGTSFLDRNNILYKLNDSSKLIGKRVIESKDRKYVWLSDVGKEEVLVWIHGEDADYDEIFEK